ncbi:hypothetical protein CDES_04345 [Corynebacterium deserti GIMN1.010]|uniref:Uncharacterized protein n=1 Tax=Corynebacterium deserti GIMN1.010 TaxID=931089 RepID=A0A0M4CIH2_9CORY|nr:putative nucleotidyltransferase substrate binding domain-containing protein [Corynebacterium deserti]ALC05314.1 hypothetical protein CDES_04345 [Corynebacterium deserti GIMN1.010]
MLHPSLTELADAAPHAQDRATVRGVLKESLDLLSNALKHGEDPAELAGWLSQIITDVLHSPGIDAHVVLTGPVGRGDALPTSPVRWLAVVDKQEDPNAEIAALLTEVGFVAEPIGAATREEWEARARAGEDAAAFLDAGTWVADIVEVDDHALLQDALDSRPPAVETYEGLPSLDMAVNVREDLMIPTVKIARWAAHQAGSLAPTTAQRLIDARGVLTIDEADALTQVWKSALNLQSRRWMDHIHEQHATAWELPALQRATFGASARLLSEVLRSIEAREMGTK